MIHDTILKTTKASRIKSESVIQRLWTGFGSIKRYDLEGSTYKSVVVKHIILPDENSMHMNAHDAFAHKRKLKSYDVELAFYKDFAHACDGTCRIPKYIAEKREANEILLILEDLNADGYPIRKNRIPLDTIEYVLEWLANFHATFMNSEPQNLWKVGTYWHLDTRPEELEALDDIALKNIAQKLDTKLNNCTYKTFVHGDAKIQNFCFSNNLEKVSAVDFQYVGAGCGMKDVAYFLSSCFSDNEVEKLESQLLGIYFEKLEKALKNHNHSINFFDLKKEWTEMYYYAWTDFYRFLKGWEMGWYPANSYSEKISKKIINKLS